MHSISSRVVSLKAFKFLLEPQGGLSWNYGMWQSRWMETTTKPKLCLLQDTTIPWVSVLGDGMEVVFARLMIGHTHLSTPMFCTVRSCGVMHFGSHSQCSTFSLPVGGCGSYSTSWEWVKTPPQPLVMTSRQWRGSFNSFKRGTLFHHSFYIYCCWLLLFIGVVLGFCLNLIYY